MLFGTTLGLLSLWIIWYQQLDTRFKLNIASILAILYWITQAGSITFPGTALVDPEFAHPDQLPAQLIVDVVVLVLLAISYYLQSNRLQRFTD